MQTAAVDNRSPERRALDEAIAAEPQLAPPELTASACPLPVEAYLAKKHRPFALAGIVENGLVRPLDSAMRRLSMRDLILRCVRRELPFDPLRFKCLPLSRIHSLSALHLH